MSAPLPGALAALGASPWLTEMPGGSRGRGVRMEQGSLALLVPRGWRAFAPSGWLHGVLSLTQCWCCHPPPWGAAGCLWACCLSSFGCCIPLHPLSSPLVRSSGLPHPSRLWVVAWGLDGGGWWVPGWDMAGAEATGVTVAQFFFLKLAFCCDHPAPSLNNPLLKSGLGKHVLLS